MPQGIGATDLRLRTDLERRASLFAQIKDLANRSKWERKKGRQDKAESLNGQILVLRGRLRELRERQ